MAYALYILILFGLSTLGKERRKTREILVQGGERVKFSGRR
jgi:hypothetical protein